MNGSVDGARFTSRTAPVIHFGRCIPSGFVISQPIPSIFNDSRVSAFLLATFLSARFEGERARCRPGGGEEGEAERGNGNEATIYQGGIENHQRFFNPVPSSRYVLFSFFFWVSHYCSSL